MIAPLFLLSLLAAPPDPRPAQDERVIVNGNNVLLDEIYRAVVDLPKDATIDQKTAAQSGRRVLRFLRRAGYVLATVTASASQEQIHLQIDEGRLDKIIYPGLGSYSMLRMRLELVLPGDVFNRDYLKRHLAEIAKRHNFESVTWQLVKTASVVHAGPQLEDVEGAEDAGLVPEPGIYELHIKIVEDDGGAGLSPTADYESPDGLQLGALYDFGYLFTDDDRWSAEAGVGLRIQDGISRGAGRRFISRLAAELEYLSPELFTDDLRLRLVLPAQALSRQRLDLDIKSYDYLLVDPSLSLVSDRLRWLKLSIGGGVEYRRLFSVSEGPRPRPRLDPTAALSPFVLAGAEVIFDPANLRRDQTERVILNLHHYFRSGSLTRLEVQYRNTINLGWDEFRYKLGGSMVLGTVPFIDEVSVGDYLRGVFGSDLFSHRTAGLGLEYRLSISRDYIKISAFHDLAVFSGIDRFTAETSARLANAFGLGLHILIADSFQLSTYGSYGFTHRRSSFGGTLSLARAF